MPSPTISIRNGELLNQMDSSSLKANASVGDGTLSVYSISKFAVNQILLIGAFGQEATEIIATHPSTAPSGNTVTLASTLSQAHAKDVLVTVLLYDKVEVLYATTEDGSKSSLTTLSLDPQESDTTYIPSNTTGFYFLRWYNSVTSTYSDYSDAIPAGGFDSNTVSFIIDSALSETGKDIGGKLTIDSLIGAINSCLRYIRGKLKKWSNVEEFDYEIDTINRGEYRWALPASYYDKNSNRSMLEVRVRGVPLSYVDQVEMRRLMYGSYNTTIATEVLAADTTMTLTNAADFNESGTVHVYSGVTQYEITYTGKSGNTLTGIPASGDGSVSSTLAAGLSVWQGESESTPTVYTISDGYIEIWPLSNVNEAGRSIVADFYTDIVEVNSDSDEIDLARFDMIKHWVKWHIRNVAERNGKPDFTDGDWTMFNTILTDAVRRETTGQKYKTRVRMNGITYRMGSARYKGDPTLYQRS